MIRVFKDQTILVNGIHDACAAEECNGAASFMQLDTQITSDRTGSGNNDAFVRDALYRDGLAGVVGCAGSRSFVTCG